jgi:hypothetical protein
MHQLRCHPQARDHHEFTRMSGGDAMKVVGGVVTGGVIHAVHGAILMDGRVGAAFGAAFARESRVSAHVRSPTEKSFRVKRDAFPSQRFRLGAGQRGGSRDAADPPEFAISTRPHLADVTGKPSLAA